MDAYAITFTFFNKSVSFGIRANDDGTFSGKIAVGTGLSVGYEAGIEGVWEIKEWGLHFEGYSAVEALGTPSGAPIVLSFALPGSEQSQVTLGLGINDWFDVSATISYVSIDGSDPFAWEFADHDIYDQQPTFANAESITSPIIIDLDKDGIETSSLAEGVFFDHDNNGLAEQTAWADSDDGILVMDRNGDGVINSGAELFGNNTRLADGSMAANGFEALAELDTNNDGIIDFNDEQFSNLSVWRDLNQDGVSEANELLSLDEAGVSALSTGFADVNQTDANGNKLLQSGTATLADGSEVVAGDIWFKTNSGLTQTRDLLALNESIKSLPSAQGFGTLHNLDQAMARDATLQSLVQGFVDEADPSVRRSRVDSIIYQWAGVADVDPFSRDPSRIYSHLMDARQLETLEALTGQDYLGTWCWGERDPNPHGRAAPVLLAQYQAFSDFVFAQLQAQTEYESLFNLIGVRWDSDSLSFKPDMGKFIRSLELILSEGDFDTPLAVYRTLSAMGTYSTTYAHAAKDVEQAPGLMVLLASNLVSGTDSDDYISATSGNDLIHAKAGDDKIAGGAGDDIYRFNLGDGVDQIYDSSGNDRLQFGAHIVSDDLRFTRTATALVISVLDQNGVETGDQLMIDNLFDFDGSVAEGAIESLHFADGSFLSLSDALTSIEQFATQGADQLYGTANADGFDGGLGDDQLYGGAGDDIYYYERGDGVDEIYEHSGTDTLMFGPEIGPEDLQIKRIGDQGEDILIELLDQQGLPSGDQILIRDAYQNLLASNNQIEWLRFADDIEDLPPLALIDLVKAFGISDDANRVFGFESDDRITANDGDDQIYGAGGDDRLFGEAGNDTLYGGAGKDLLSGGIGDDLLSGGAGDDSYHFSVGQGHDRIRNLDSEGFDSVLFDSSINSRKVDIARLGDDLLVSINRNADSLLIENYFSGDRISSSAIDQFLFADGSILGVDQVAHLSMQSTRGDDLILGLDTPDQIAAQAGDDLIRAGGGDDQVFGEQGDDQIYGDAGDDRLDGGSGNDLLFGGLGADQLFGGNGVDVLKGNAGSDHLLGQNGTDHLLGGTQSDQLEGGRGDDWLEGESGDDTLFGGEGDDLLIGGSGNDLLDGGRGNDRYVYRAGDGNDRITESGDPKGFDILQVEAFNDSDLWLTQRDDDLIVSFNSHANAHGDLGEVSVEGWFNNPSNLDAIVVNEQVAYGADIERMLEAMIAFDAAESESEVALADDRLQLTLTQSWHPNPS